MDKEKQSRMVPGPAPEGFTLFMALVDCLPVLFFSVSSAILAARFNSRLFQAGVLLVILAGALKAGWKFVIALQHRDLRFLNKQMRYLMPAGFLLIILALFVDRSRWSIAAVIRHMTNMPALFLFLTGAAGMGLMVWFAQKKDRRDAKANWKEQITNSVAQFCIMLGILL